MPCVTPPPNNASPFLVLTSRFSLKPSPNLWNTTHSKFLRPTTFIPHPQFPLRDRFMLTRPLHCSCGSLSPSLHYPCLPNDTHPSSKDPYFSVLLQTDAAIGHPSNLLCLFSLDRPSRVLKQPFPSPQGNMSQPFSPVHLLNTTSVP